jgi:hypothetical protein
MVKLTILSLHKQASAATILWIGVAEVGDMAVRGDWRTVAATCGIAAASIFIAPLIILLSLFMRADGTES